MGLSKSNFNVNLLSKNNQKLIVFANIRYFFLNIQINRKNISKNKISIYFHSL